MEELLFKVDRIYKLPDKGPIKAFVDLNINEVLVIKGLKVIEGQQGLFVAMPQEQGKDKKWYESMRCLNNEIKNNIQNKVVEAYLKVI